MNFLHLLKSSIRLWIDKGADQHAAALAYFTPFAMTPLLLVSITIVGLIIGREDVVDLLLRWGGLIDADLPAFMQTSLSNLESVTSSYSFPFFAVVFLSVMIVFALNSLATGLHQLWDIPESGFRNFFKRSFRAVLFLLVFQVYLVLTIIFNNIFANMSAFYGWWIFSLMSMSVFFISTTVLITIGYGLLPSISPKFVSRFYGALLATAFFFCTRSLLSFHIAHTPTPDMFGAARLILVLLLWVYMSACIVYLGAAFAKVHEAQTN